MVHMKDMCSCYINLTKNTKNQSLETKTVSGMSKAGEESSAADISMGLVVVHECEKTLRTQLIYSLSKPILFLSLIFLDV